MLYQLLTGQMPYVPKDAKLNNIAIWKAVRAGPPPALHELAPDTAGELVAICEKAMQREIAQRYPTMSELAEDLSAYLEGRVVRAYETGTWAETRKWVRRNKPLAGSLAAALVVSVIGIAVVLAKNRVIESRNADLATKTEEARLLAASESAAKEDALDREKAARTAAAKAERVSDFIRTILASIDPETAKGEDTKLLRRILDQASADLGTDLEAEPEVAGALHYTLGQAFLSIGALEPAERHLLAAEAAQTRTLGPDAKETLQTRRKFANVLQRSGRVEEAEQLARKNLEDANRLFGETAREALGAKMELGEVLGYALKLPEAEATVREATERIETILPPSDALALHANYTRGVILWRLNRSPEAEERFRAVWKVREEAVGPDHPATINAIGMVALSLNAQGDFVGAEKLNREALERALRVYGPYHQNTLTVQNNLAGTLARQDGKLEEAEKLFRETLEARRRTLGADHPETLTTMRAFSSHLLAWSRIEEAESLAREALEGSIRRYGAESVEAEYGYGALGSLQNAQGKYTEAAAQFGEQVRLLRRRVEDEDLDLPILMYNWAACLQDSGNHEQAAPVYREVLELHRKAGGKDEPFIAAAWNGLAKCLDAEEKYAQADECFEKGLEMRLRLFGETHDQTSYSLVNYGETLLDRGEFARAEPYLEKYLAIRNKLDPEGWQNGLSMSLFGAAIAGQGRFAEAEEWLTRGADHLDGSPPEQATTARAALRRVLDFYDDWARAEPGLDLQSKIAAWKARAERFDAEHPAAE
ncbi:MAG: tetratricopeptide repeat protein [Planctomycetota bacterium]|nr:MAG: tetratricopeptide repeat protein [Planctomycetota bacterium]